MVLYESLETVFAITMAGKGDDFFRLKFIEAGYAFPVGVRLPRCWRRGVAYTVVGFGAGTGGDGGVGIDENSSPLVGEAGCLWIPNVGFIFSPKKCQSRGLVFDATLLLLSGFSFSWLIDGCLELFDTSDVALAAFIPSFSVLGDVGELSGVFCFESCHQRSQHSSPN